MLETSLLILTVTLIGVISLNMLGNMNRIGWLIWLLFFVLTAFLPHSDKLTVKEIISVLGSIICLLGYLYWSSSKAENIKRITWSKSSSLIAFIFFIIIGAEIFVHFRKYSDSPIFESIGGSSLIVAMAMLAYRKVAAWFVLIYSFLMYTIMYAITKNPLMTMEYLVFLAWSIFCSKIFISHYETKEIGNMKIKR